MSQNFNLAAPFYYNSVNNPHLLALKIDDKHYSYADLAERAQAVSTWLQHIKPQKLGRVGIFASRTIEACAGALGVAWAGGTYVPINHKWPDERLKSVFKICEFDALILDAQGAKLLSEMELSICPKYILAPDKNAIKPIKDQIHTIIDDFASITSFSHEPRDVKKEDIAYIIFTSGTTGIPKGVEISLGAIAQHVKAMQQIYEVTPNDRVAQVSDLSFDIAISNLFVAWNAGASLHVVPQTQVMAPANFIRENNITFWFCVPSIIHFMHSLKMLKPNAFPSLRCSIFAGEALPLQSALHWQQAAPNSIVDNTYGPTEGTVVCVYQRLPKEAPFPEQRSIMALGKAFPGSKIAVIDDNHTFLSSGETGQLALSGMQLASGYFNLPELSDERFPLIDGERWYLTGDKGVKDNNEIFYHLGRLDSQVKIMGYRVELEDIEFHLRIVCDCDAVAAIAWPITNGSASGIVGFVCGATKPLSKIREELKKRLPTYMIPSSIHCLENLPMTPNGKVDRKMLVDSLKEKKNE